MDNFYDIGTGDLKELWDTDLDHSAMQEAFKLSSDDMHDWFLERDVKLPPVILHDKLMTDALLGTVPIKSEHSYSLNSDGDSLPDSPGSLHNKMDDTDDDCYHVISINSALYMNRHHNDYGLSSNSNNSYNMETASMSSSSSEVDIDDSNIKEEPLSPNSSCPASPSNASTLTTNATLANMAAFTNSDLVFEHKVRNGSLQLSSASQSLLKSQQLLRSPQKTVMPKLNIKTESPNTNAFGLPPTPPSSSPSDDSEGNQSPEHRLSPNLASSMTTTNATTRKTLPSMMQTTNGSAQSSPTNNTITRIYNGTSTRQPIHTPLISNQPKGSTGTLILTEEEKRTLLAEGYPIPTRLPLTKAEEKSLKKIRRKIKNKISAQESRRKKKEYMDQLERKVEILVSENTNYRKRVENLEDSNANLLNQLAKLQSLISRQNVKHNNNSLKSELTN